MATLKTPYTSKNWLVKVLAALVPGVIFTLGLTGVVGLLCHTNGNPQSASGQYLMWLTALVWSTLLSTCFLFRSGRQAWGYLSLGCAIVWAAYFLLRSTMA
ncbi:hypothetical protein [Acetobacter orientalis]|uniref:hypothetical protein n=1 Tax=Acetobacter orientalis TaxID=146474 RepID=UPI0039ED59B4